MTCMRAQLLLTLALTASAGAQRPGARPHPLDSASVTGIATLLMLEDTRAFDSSTLARLLHADHPEVRRQAELAVARINDPRGVALLRADPLDADTALAATTVFAVGQLRDTLTIPWLDSLLSNPRTPPTVMTEAACALGKIKTPASRAVLARFLTSVKATPRTRDAIGEALLSIGRATSRGDLAPITRWTSSRDGEIRWRAAWALFRPRDPAAVSSLLALSNDPSGTVRLWAVRGLVKSQADSAGVGQEAEARLESALTEPDRRVRTEAIRALGTYTDSAAVAALTTRLGSSDSWISVSAAEGLATARAAWTIPALREAARQSPSCAVRVTAMRTLRVFADSDARAAAATMATDTVPYCQSAAEQLLRDTIPPAARAGGRGGPGQRQRPALTARPMAEYRAIVERWIAPVIAGKPLPRARWQTTRGPIELELYAADAPLATDALAHIMDAGTIVGTTFTRVVPDFVDQQATIRDASVQRDEVNRHRLTRGNLAWASAGLDTGRPGYTLNHAPQPHNEGDFTSLGRVVSGQDVVDRIELGDRVTEAGPVSPIGH